MEDNYKSKYSGELVDAAVEYFLNHSLIALDNSYSYTRLIFCEKDTTPSLPFTNNQLPIDFPSEFPIIGTDYSMWYEYPNTSSKNWYLCVLTINKTTNKVTSQSQVLPMSGEKGDNGLNGNDGTNGTNGSNGLDGNDGKNGNYTECRYCRSTAWALSMSASMRKSRYPDGWELDPSTVGLYTEELLLSLSDAAFEKLVSTMAGDGPISGAQWLVFNYSTFDQINEAYYENTGHYIGATTSQLTIILLCYLDFKNTYYSINLSIYEKNQKFHTLYTKYIDSDHQWNLFMITATIDGESNTVIGEWSTPIKLTGNDGSAGPEGNPGISGIPGVSIGVAFAIGNENSYYAEANPLLSPFNKSYSALIAQGTGWYTTTSDCITTDDYPYIWVTLCRYYINSNGEEVLEDPWGTPFKYTGTNGITTTVLVKLPIIYPQGIYDRNTRYINDGNSAPYVYFDGAYYYLAILLSNGWYGVDNDPSNLGLLYYISDPPDETHPWIRFEQFNAIFAKVGIIANGLIGSAVFNGDYMFSQRGLARSSSNPSGIDTTTINNVNYLPSSHYENFMKDYITNETVSVTSSRNAFVPHYWINLATGEFGSTSMDTAINNGITETLTAIWQLTINYLSSYYASKSELEEKSSLILLTSSQISFNVKSEINGLLRSAGIDITSGKVKVTGEFEGTMDGTFNGDVSAKSLTVLGDDGTPAIVFDTYKSEMGTPAGGVAPAVGTPVLLMNYRGSQYMVNMLKLTTSTSNVLYEPVNAVIASIGITLDISNITGTLSASNTLYRITNAPYLRVKASDNTPTSLTIPAVLYDSNGTTELSWSSILNKYYEGTLIVEYSDKTNINLGKWAFKKVGTLASVNAGSWYKVTPVTRYIGNYLGNVSPWGHSYTSTLVYLYNQISLTNGSLANSKNCIVTGPRIDLTTNNGATTTSIIGYYMKAGNNLSGTKISGTTLEGTTLTSSNFLKYTSSYNILSISDVDAAASIVGPQIAS